MAYDLRQASLASARQEKALSRKDGVLFPRTLGQVYTQNSLSNQAERWAKLVKTFKNAFSHPPQFVARAPGRINIIGEHIDYSRFSVLPAAIEPDLLIAASAQYPHGPHDLTQGSKAIPVRAINTNPSYPEASFTYYPYPSKNIPIGDGGWSDYLKSAFDASLRHLGSLESDSFGDLHLPTSIELMVDGTVPAGSGLSSSAAITTAAVLAAFHIHQSIRQSAKQHIPKDLVASIATAAERACGVSVGGMDQTASVYGQPAKLLHIEFTPTTNVVPLQLPRLPPTTFIIANSLVTSTKLDSAKEQYNLRVVECRIATRMLADKFLPEKKQYPKDLRELVELYSPDEPIPRAIQLLLDKLSADDTLCGGNEGLTHQAILADLGINQQQFEVDILHGMPVEPRGGIYKPYNRARHVLSEALRVCEVKALLEKTAGADHPEEVILSIGRLMTASQTSCKQDYECSCAALDKLVSIAEANGSLGSRLTGAGWGGSSVHLVRDPDISKVITALKAQYYAVHFPGLSAQELADACFATKPEAGACVFMNPAAPFS